MNLISNLSQQFYEFSTAFPKLALASYKTVSQLTQSLSSLSPKAKQNLYKIVNFGYKCSSQVYSSLMVMYIYWMEKLNVNLFDWEEPSWLILYPLAYLICFLFPVNSYESSVRKDIPCLFVANRSVYSLDTLPLICTIYLKTGIWPRVAADAYNFKIPIWRQVIEYFGAYQDSRKVSEKMIALNYSILLYPGGLNETFRKVDDSLYSLSWDTDFLRDLELSDACFQLIPVSMIGMNDMLSPVMDVDISPMLWWMGYKDKKQTIPIVYPSSYQRLYVCIGSSVPLKQSQEMATVVSKGIYDLLCIRDMDQRRYLLRSVGWIIQKSSSWMVAILDRIEFRSLAKKGGKKVYEWGVTCLESF